MLEEALRKIKRVDEHRAHVVEERAQGRDPNSRPT